MHGRGFRGFQKTDITDETTGIRSTVFYERDYRCISTKVRRTEQRLPDSTLINEVDNEIAVMDFGHGVHFSYVKKSTAKNYEIDASLVSTTVTRTTYDNYGNPLTIAVDYGNGHRDSTINTYTNHIAQWHLGRLTRAEVIKEVPGKVPQSRVSEFAYDPASGLLTQEVLDAGEAGLQLEKRYYHDTYGNILQSDVIGDKGSGTETRSHFTRYDERGRFVLQSTNALGHAEDKIYDEQLGNVLALTGPNGLTTLWNHDDFGRPIQEVRADGTQSATAYRLCDSVNDLVGACYKVYARSSGGPLVITYYDTLDREIRRETTGFNGQQIYTDTRYNTRGEAERVSEPYFSGDNPLWSTLEYDIIGRNIRETGPDSAITQTTYQGFTTIVTNPLGQSQTKVTDVRGQLVTSTDNAGGTISYSYDIGGELGTAYRPGR